MTRARIRQGTMALAVGLWGCTAPEPAGVSAVAPVPGPPAPVEAVAREERREEALPPPVSPPPEPAPLPAPPAPAAPPPAAQDAPALLEAWRRRVQADGPGRELDLARSHLLSGQPLRAHELLAAIDPKRLPSEEARLSWRLAEAEALSRLGEPGKALDLLQESERSLRPLAPLQVSGECFSADPKRRQKLESPRFHPGQAATVYLDLDRLTVAPEEGKGFRTRLRFDLTLLEPAGREVFDFADWEREQGVLEEHMHRAWEDHAYRLSFRLPQRANLGAYVLKLEVTDLAGPAPRKAVVSLPLTLE